MLEPGAVFGGYRIEGVLGRGGMGAVYEATQLSLKRAVALKVLSEQLGHERVVRERFRREALLQAGIEHPHIVTVYEAGEIESRSFIAMRVIRGPNLRQLIRLDELTDERTLKLLAPIADALDIAHRAALIHRDIKPENVLVGAGDHAYLADFGITKSIDQTTLTRTGQFMGTPHYVAPEQVMGEPASPASDVYGLAAVMFECLTGRAPFAERDSTPAILFAHVHVPPPRVSDARPDLPSDVDEAIARGMSKDPAERQSSATALVSDVERALTGEPATATTRVVGVGEEVRDSSAGTRRPFSGSLRQARWARAVALAALPLVAIVVGVGVLSGRGDDRSRARDGRVPGEPAAGPAAGDGAVVTLGSALPGNSGQDRCAYDKAVACTVAQRALPGGRVVSSIDGVISRWRVRNADGVLALQVVAGSATRRAVRTSDRVRARVGGVRTFATRLQISRGQGVALLVGEGARFSTAWRPRSAFIHWTPPLGASPTAPDDSGLPNLELLLNADVERDRDRDGYGDASQDECPDDPRRQGGC